MVNKIHGINGEYNLVFWGIHPKLWFCGMEKGHGKLVYIILFKPCCN